MSHSHMDLDLEFRNLLKKPIEVPSMYELGTQDIRLVEEPSLFRGLLEQLTPLDSTLGTATAIAQSMQYMDKFRESLAEAEERLSRLSIQITPQIERALESLCENAYLVGYPPQDIANVVSLMFEISFPELKSYGVSLDSLEELRQHVVSACGISPELLSEAISNESTTNLSLCEKFYKSEDTESYNKARNAWKKKKFFEK